MERACIECKQTPAENGYYDIDIGRICHDCFDSTVESDSVAPKPIFVKKVCKTHRCSTYNHGLMGAHEMPWCDIESVETYGVTKPCTKYDSSLGGLNGNIGRHYYKDWTTYCQQKDRMIHEEKEWQEFRDIHGRRRTKKQYAYN